MLSRDSGAADVANDPVRLTVFRLPSGGDLHTVVAGSSPHSGGSSEGRRRRDPSAGFSATTGAEVRLTPDGDGVRLELGDEGFAAIWVELPEFDIREWAHVVIRARTEGGAGGLKLFYNPRTLPNGMLFPAFFSRDTYLIRDGAVHTYQIPTNRFERPPLTAPLRQLAIGSRIPLLFIWPGHFDGGRRLAKPVSMIDVLPTLLELAGLDPPEVSQGQSLAPLLLGREGWEPQPVIFDQVRTSDGSGQFYFRIEVADGRWGASLLVPADPGEELELPEDRMAVLQIYDLWDDPNALTPVNAERPDLVGKYREFLEAQWAAHQALAQHIGAAGKTVALTQEQLETLRALGYIR